MNVKKKKNYFYKINNKKKKKIIIIKREELNFKVEMGNRDLDWKTLMEDPTLQKMEGCVPIDSNHPLYILYTSGNKKIQIKKNNK